MKTSTTYLLLAGALLLAISPFSRAADTSANPDRPFVQVSILDDMYVDGEYQAITNRYMASQNIGGSIIMLTGTTYLPLNNKLTIHGSVGTTLNHQIYEQTSQLTGYNTHTKNLTLSAGARYYFMVRDLWAARGTENPERRAYVDLTVTETPIFDGHQHITTNMWAVDRGVSGNSLNMAAYTNIPLNSRWAFQGQLSGSMVGSSYAQTQLVSGTNTRYSTVEVMGGLRYYLRD